MTLDQGTNPFTQPIQTVDGYPRIADHALVGDGATAALVGMDATIRWLCLPRFDGPALFASLLDAEQGGAWTVQPAGLREVRQHYLADTAVVVTDLRCDTGTVQVTDAMVVDGTLGTGRPSGPGELARLVTVLQGEVDLRIHLTGRGGLTPSAGTGEVTLGWPDAPDPVKLTSTRTVDGLDRLDGSVRLRAGDRLGLVLRWADGPTRLRTADEVEAALDSTAAAWRTWTTSITYTGPYEDLVRRSAITLKLCDHHASGAIVAAPTSSLPEAIGGERNWDYRFTWVRDAAYTVYALRCIGLADESEGFLTWILDACLRDGRPHILYTLDGTQPGAEHIDPDLEGYRGSAPVRWGNAAADQVQHDVYGEILDCAWQWVRGGGTVDDLRWAKLVELGAAAEDNWRTPDHGIWEIRDAGRPFTYSVAMCQVAADRMARIAASTGRSDEEGRWRKLADTIHAHLLEQAWDPDAGHLTEHLGQPGTVDASLLALPLRRVLDAGDPRMTATVDAVVERLGAGNDLLYRYLPAESPDGLRGEEGAFLLCSFWWVDNLAQSGRVDEARERFERLCARVNHVGLLPEQIDPTNGQFLGNFPQAFSHIGLISSAVNLARTERVRAGNR
ncbi:glycoside hydrolase family 15 protein [Micromonospora sp. NPDC050795]|uniref:glycoside hydrolase family 15 protein n=1 Tax=Micromonospora sp. NPDC050795 TaxID=3364282 RepID=UPI0037AA04F1